jgi:phage baseplate assembly protein gpV
MLDDYDDRITGDLQILSPLTFGNREMHIPKIGTPVICIFVGGDGLDIGFIIGAYFSEENKSDSKDGEYILDFNSSKMTITDNGKIDITTDTTTITSKVVINGDVTINGANTVSGAIKTSSSMTASGGISGAGIELTKHKHKDSVDGMTGEPIA